MGSRKMKQQIFADGGVQTVPEIAIQYVYLDFDGALTSYNGEILTVDDVEVQDSSLTEERILKIIAELNKKYAAQNVVFVSERPQTDEYSTIFVGKTSAFDEYGNFVGLAETIDSGNKNKKDNAFVMLDSTDSDEQIISMISHETDHLLGTLNHGGDGLEAYAADYYVNSGEILTDVVLEWGDSMTISSGGVANNTTVNNGRMDTTSGGVASNTTVNDGDMYISSGGVASNTIVSGGGWLHLLSSGVASNTTVNDGDMYISSGGVANSTTVNSDGSMYISSGGVAKHTVLNQGSLYISSGGVHRGIMSFADNTVHASAYAGAVVDFTVSERTSFDGYLINNLSLITGTPDYTITVYANQASGTYKLARGAYDLDGAITIGDGTTEFGAITINGSDLSYDEKTYSLDCVNGDLTLTVIGGPDAGGNSNGVYWEKIPGDKHTVEFSNDGFSDVLQVEASGNSLDIYGMPSGTYQYRVQDENGRYVYGEDIVAEEAAGPQELASDANGNMDLFFARANRKWKNSYMAEHEGVLNGWEGTGEIAELYGRNKLADIFEGSSDANVLVMTDDANGDALFVDDVYTALGDQARLSQIDEIRAGAGDDIVDMTSQQFSYIGDGVTIYGGSGDDVIWANNGNNILFGDAGSDRIVGGSGNDVIIGGSGDDSMHGGGGNDTFTFGENWGYDTVEQLNGGEVILWFESGSESNWDASTLTYSDGINSVQVIGVSAEDVTLKFGGDVSSLPSGCFEDAASEKIFEDYNKGMIA